MKNHGDNHRQATKLSLYGIGLALLTGCAILALAPAAYAAGSALGMVAGSTHNFSLEAWNPTAEICRVCHVPHDHENAAKRYLNGLLWNHSVTSQTYTMYNSTWSSTLDNTQSTQPDGISKLCLGCHDGVNGIDTFDKYAGGFQTMSDFNPNFIISKFTDGANLDLRGTHPLSIIYDESVDTNLHAKTDPMGTSGTIEDVLDNGKVQCSSCHDVHDGVGEAVAGTHLLRVAQTGATPSGLCLTCHKK